MTAGDYGFLGQAGYFGQNVPTGRFVVAMGSGHPEGRG